MTSKKEKLGDLISQVIESEENGFWKSLDELVDATGSSPNDITEAIEECGNFIENSNKKFTTRKIYEKETPFHLKLIHSLKNKIY